MTDRPILFSAPMVRALLAGTKTQTRRLAKWRDVEPGLNLSFSALEPSRLRTPGTPDGEWVLESRGVGTQWTQRARLSTYAQGERLWVRETCKYDWTDADWRYVADDLSVVTERGCHLDRPTPHRWPVGVVPSLFMPRWASRLTLTVTEVRVQRLQEISKADVIAEGITEREGMPIADVVAGWHEPYAQLWDSLNGTKPGRGWAANPWIVAITFRAERRNIDAKPTLATAGGAA